MHWTSGYSAAAPTLCATCCYRLFRRRQKAGSTVVASVTQPRPKPDGDVTPKPRLRGQAQRAAVAAGFGRSRRDQFIRELVVETRGAHAEGFSGSRAVRFS